ncbi:unnamed protein product [Dovyalis caffra]|uniref:Uncharacterized protein n=1 Tax=Dovyalis caffra TaxID=77055 RepID=A0AAV1S9D0_9ROSI|nr:unnamed protein product [Dovyalis caffra]
MIVIQCDSPSKDQLPCPRETKGEDIRKSVETAIMKSLSGRSINYSIFIENEKPLPHETKLDDLNTGRQIIGHNADRA